MRAITAVEKMNVESLIDQSSVRGLLLVIAEICNEKSQHIEENWTDSASLARIWSNAAQRIDACATTQSVRQVSQ